MEIYVVKEGDTVDSIADNFGISAASIIFNNQLFYPYALAIGQALLLSVGTPPSRSYSAYVNGYAYPFIRQDVLDDTLPYLTSLSVFSYGFTTEGELVPPEVDDTFMIRSALMEGVRPFLTLTPFGPDGNFNNFLISTLVNSEEVKSNLLSNLLSTLSEKGFQGVDIDFEYILPEDRIPFADFVADTRDYLAPYGYHVSVALAPKTSDTQSGLLYAGKDYRLLGEAADSVLLMTYEWGYTYGHSSHTYFYTAMPSRIYKDKIIDRTCSVYSCFSILFIWYHTKVPLISLPYLKNLYSNSSLYSGAIVNVLSPTLTLFFIRCTYNTLTIVFLLI